MVIYRITNLINNKCYIGKTKQDFETYIQTHINNAFNKNFKHYDKVLYKAFRKHGIENFKFEIIEICKDASELNEKEIYYIEYFNSISYGYNVTIGGDGGPINLGKSISTKNKTYEEIYGEEEAKRLKDLRKIQLIGNKFGEKNKDLNANISFDEKFGKERSAQIRNKISIANSGKSKPSKNKNKTYEQIYGEEKAQRLKKEKSIIAKQTHPKDVSLVERYGKQKAQEICNKISNTLSNKPTKYLWKLTNIITNEILILKNKEMEKFCSLNNISARTMRGIAYGKDKKGHRNNWACERISGDA